jgi:hypothetical protein
MDSPNKTSSLLVDVIKDLHNALLLNHYNFDSDATTNSKIATFVGAFQAIHTNDNVTKDEMILNDYETRMNESINGFETRMNEKMDCFETRMNERMDKLTNEVRALKGNGKQIIFRQRNTHCDGKVSAIERPPFCNKNQKFLNRRRSASL